MRDVFLCEYVIRIRVAHRRGAACHFIMFGGGGGGGDDGGDCKGQWRTHK